MYDEYLRLKRKQVEVVIKKLSVSEVNFMILLPEHSDARQFDLLEYSNYEELMMIFLILGSYSLSNWAVNAQLW